MTKPSITEHEVELDGKRCVCLRRSSRTIQEEPGDVPYDVIEYSFDRGVTWHLTQIDAYKVAVESDKLMTVHDPGGEAGEYEAFVMALLLEIQGLKEGERLITIMLGGLVTVVKEQAVLAVRASTIKEIDLKVEAPGG